MNDDDDEADRHGDKRKSPLAPLALGGIGVLLAVMVVATLWWPPKGGTAPQSEKPSPTTDGPYRESTGLEELCTAMDWSAAKPIVKIAEPIEERTDLRQIGNRDIDAWDATCKASDDPPEGEVYALVGVSVADTVSQAETAYADLKRLPAIPIGSVDDLECVDAGGTAWQEAESCRSEYDSSLYLGLHHVARAANLVVVTGIIHGGGELDDLTTDKQRKTLVDDMALASSKLADQARTLVDRKE